MVGCYGRNHHCMLTDTFVTSLMIDNICPYTLSVFFLELFILQSCARNLFLRKFLLFLRYFHFYVSYDHDFLPVYSPESVKCFEYPEAASQMIFGACIALWKQNLKENMVKIKNFETFWNPIWTKFLKILHSERYTS